MPIPIHVVYIRLLAVDPLTGAPLDKNSPATTLNAVARSRHEFRVQPSRPGIDPLVPNAADQPDVPTFLAREAADGYSVAHHDQRLIVLYQE